MKPLWIRPFTILSANNNRNNYSLYLSTDPSLNLIYKNFQISKVKPYIKNNDILFPQYQLVKPRDIFQDRYEVKKVMEYCKAPRTGIPQYKVHWSGYSLAND